MSDEATPAAPPRGTHAPTYIIITHDRLDDRWHTSRTHDIADAALAAEMLADRLGWADVWRAYPGELVHYGRVRDCRPRYAQRSTDAALEAVSIATSRWYAAVTLGDVRLADEVWAHYAEAIEGLGKTARRGAENARAA